MGVTEIGRTLGMNKSTVHRILATLEQRGMVQQDAENGRYWLGLKLYSLGMAVSENMPLKAVASPYIRALSQQFNEVVHLGVLDRAASVDPRFLIVDKIQIQQFLNITPSIGFGAPCHCSGLGKCLLAFTPSEYVATFTGAALSRYTEKTIIDWPSLLAELAFIRRQGYAIDNEELEVGLSCIAAPILANNGLLIGGVSLSGPTYRIQASQVEMIAAVQETAQKISQQID